MIKGSLARSLQVSADAHRVLDKYRALRAHVCGPRMSWAETVRRRAAVQGHREGPHAEEARQARHHAHLVARPFYSVGWIASVKQRRDDIILEACEAVDELYAMHEALGAQRPTRANDVDERLRTMADIVELIGLARRALYDCSPLSRDHLDELQLSTIDADLARDAGLWTETWAPFVALMLCDGVQADFAEWLAFPYFRPGHPNAVMYRVKKNTSRAGARPYRQPTGVRSGIYYPPCTLRSGGLRDTEIPLVWTEGEKKALCLDRMGYTVVGLPGVWNGSDPTSSKKNRELHPWIREDVAVAGRRHIIAFDRDIQTNIDIRKAATRLTQMLTKAGAAEVRLVDWPEADSWIKGIDDLASYRKDDAVRALLAGAQRASGDDLLLPANIMGAAGPTAAQKVALAAVFTRADNKGRVTGSTVNRLATAAAKSRQAMGELLSKLVDAGLITRQRGHAWREGEGFARSTDRYTVVDFQAMRTTVFRIEPSDLAISDGVALALAVLRKTGEMRVTDLGNAMGIADRTAREVVKAAGRHVNHRHGRVGPTRV